MNIAIMYYEGFVEFEISSVLFLLRNQNLIFFGLEKKPYTSYEGQTIISKYSINEISPQNIDLLIIPGGDSIPLFTNEKIKNFIQDCISNNCFVAGICGGAELLAGLGILKGKNCTGGTSGITVDDPLATYFSDSNLFNHPVVVDGLIITAQGQAQAEFASKLFCLVQGKNDLNEEMKILKWLKNDRS